MNDNEKIMDKLEKLLRLAESPNANEAYAAAQKAQELSSNITLAVATLTASRQASVEWYRQQPISPAQR